MREKTNTKTITFTDASERSSITEHLINLTDCENNYMLLRFRVVSHCNNLSNLVRLKAISIILNKLKLCKQKNVDYKASLFLKFT